MSNKRPPILLGILGLAAVLVVSSIGMARRDSASPALGMAPISAEPIKVGLSPEAPDRAIPFAVGVTSASSERPTRSSAVAAVAGPGTWRVGGHVRRGLHGQFADAHLTVRVHLGPTSHSEVVTEARIQADENGDFSWATTPPTGLVTVAVTPDEDGHKVYADTQTVPEGDLPPQGLRPFAYALDARVQGRVIDPTGNPIPGARVIAHLAEILTGEDGAYTLPMASDYRSFSIRAVADGHTEGRLALGALSPGEHQAPDLILRGDYAVQGRVVNVQGGPVHGATVYTYPRERNQTLTGADGRFHLGGLDPEKRQTRITAHMDGFVAASAQAHPGGEDPEPELVLTRGARIAGRVLTELGQPLKNAQVSVGTPYPRADKATYTDESGAFTLDVVGPGSHTVWALRPGSAPGQASIEVEESTDTLNDIEIVMGPGFSVRGVVLDGNDQPLDGVRVNPCPADPNMRYTYVGSGTFTDESGRFVMDGLTEERVALQLLAPGCSLLEKVVSAGDDVVLRPKRSGSLAGHVVDGTTGEPIRAFTVRLVEPPRTHTGSKFWDISYDWRGAGMSFGDPAGAWSTGSEPLAKGTVVGVEVSASGYAAKTVGRVKITTDPTPSDLRIELNAGATLTGSVTNSQTGAPIPGARLRRFTPGNPRDAQRYLLDEDCEAQTDDQGRFELHSVPFGSMYLIVDEIDLPVCIDGPFDVAASTVNRAIAITQGARLTGRYLDGAGQPLANHRVTLAALETPVNKPSSYSVTTNSHGTFTFEGLTTGPHHLRGYATNAGVGILELIQVEDSQTLEIDLRPTGQATLTGTIDFEGTLPPNLSVDLLPSTSRGTWASRMLSVGVQDGTFTATHLDPGNWNARIFHRADNGHMFTGSAKVLVPAEGTAKVHIAIRPLKR